MALVVKPGREVDEGALSVRLSRASGPGGQHVNKTETRVSLELDIDEAIRGWPESDQALVLHRLGSRLTKARRLIVHVDTTRSQQRNLEEARRRMASLLKDALFVPKVRRKTKPSKGALQRRLNAKKRRAELKSTRGKVDW